MLAVRLDRGLWMYLTIVVEPVGLPRRDLCHIRGNKAVQHVTWNVALHLGAMQRFSQYLFLTEYDTAAVVAVCKRMLKEETAKLDDVMSNVVHRPNVV